MDDRETAAGSIPAKSIRNAEIVAFRKQILEKQYSRDRADGLIMPRSQSLTEMTEQLEEERKIRRRANRVARATTPDRDTDPQSLRNQARQMMMSASEPVYTKPPVPSYIRERVERAAA